jgi:hypothetical protein
MVEVENGGRRTDCNACDRECKLSIIKHKTEVCSLWSTRKPWITVLQDCTLAVTSETENMRYAMCVFE